MSLNVNGICLQPNVIWIQHPLDGCELSCFLGFALYFMTIQVVEKKEIYTIFDYCKPWTGEENNEEEDSDVICVFAGFEHSIHLVLAKIMCGASLAEMQCLHLCGQRS
jgi:hypothetical protein